MIRRLSWASSMLALVDIETCADILDMSNSGRGMR
jgi:hypothetical protein